MKQTSLLALLACLGLGVTGGIPSVHAGTFTSNFNSDTNAPAGTTVNGSSFIDTTGGAEDSGVLKLTRAINSQAGSFVIDDLDAGAPVYGFDLTAKVRLGGGTSTPADGFSINFDPTATPTTQTGEEGLPGGLTFAFDIYDNTAENPPAPSIDFKVGGAVVATHKMSVADFDTGADFTDLHITVGADGLVSMAWKGAVLFTNVSFAPYQPLNSASFVFGARTGGANENQWIDNLSITTFTQPKVGITQQPASETALAGQSVRLTVAANNAETATYQWFKNGAILAVANQSTLTLSNVTLADSGAKFKATVTGPNNTATSDEITLTVKEIPLPTTPTLSFNFNDGQTPANTTVLGTAAVVANGGVADSGVLQITTDTGGVSGALVIPDPAAGAPVYGFTAQFDVLLRSAAAPADGFSFDFASDIPDDPTLNPPQGLEQGTGTGLAVSFDLYDNAGGEAPAIDVFYKNQLVASHKVPISFLMTGDQYAHVIIQLANDGAIDVVYNGVIVHNSVPVPGFSSISGGRFALAGRTGGSSADQWIDNLQITPDTTAASVRIVTQPSPQIVLLPKTATFSAEVNDPAGVTFQWYKDGTAIAGATSISYTTPATTVTDSGAKFKVTATKAAVTATSDEVTLTVLDASNPTVSYNFDNGSVPAGTVLLGNDTTKAGYVATTGGVNNSGVLRLVDALNDAAGAFVVAPLIGGAEIGTFTATFDIRVGGGTAPPADGFSFDFAPDLPEVTSTAAEDGAGSGITVGFDIYDNGATENLPAPSVDIRYKGAVVSSVHLTYQELETGDAFKTVIIHLSTDGKLDVAYGDRVLFNAVPIPGYTAISAGKFGFYARTGGLNENVWLDNVKVLAVKSTAPLRVTQDLLDVTLLPGATASFTVGLSDPNGATYKWFKNGSAIAGATTASYTTPAVTLGDTGAKFSVQATGPGGSVTSREAVLTVAAPLTISSPKFSANFDDGQVPAGAEINGSASVSNGDGILHLTDAVNSLGGSIIIPDFDNGQSVNGFTAHFKLLVGGGTTPPADGLSFVWVSDLPAGTVFGEDGSGTGLIISFDIYDNGTAANPETPPAPSIDVVYKGKLAATVHMPYTQMETGTEFADFYLRVEPDGTLDLQYKGLVIFNNVQVPGFVPMAGASFAIGARTGGLNDNQWIDNLEIATTLGAAPADKIPAPTRNADGTVTVAWTGGGTLQTTTSLSGTPQWQDVAGATSPYTLTPTSKTLFWRIRK